MAAEAEAAGANVPGGEEEERSGHGLTLGGMWADGSIDLEKGGPGAGGSTHSTLTWRPRWPEGGGGSPERGQMKTKNCE